MKIFTKALISILALISAPFAFGQASQLIGNATVTGTMTFNSGGGASFASGSTLTFLQNSATTNNLLFVANSGGTVWPLQLGSGISISGSGPYTLNVASSTTANPSASIGLTAVNGSATSIMRSDAAPALSQAIVPTWTGLHTFSITSTITGGSDYGIKITPTLNQRNATNFTLLYGNETVTQAGTGNQYLVDLQVGGTSFFTVDSGGNVLTGIWKGTAVAAGYGGTGISTFPIGALLHASSANTWAALAAGTAGYVMTAAGTGNDLAWQPLTNDFDSAFSSTQGSVLYRNASSWVAIGPGTAGQVLTTGGASANVSWSTPSAGPGTTVQHDVASYSNTTGGLEDLGLVNLGSSLMTVTISSTSATGPLVVNNSNTGNGNVASFLATGISGGNYASLFVGVAATTKNAGILSFNYASSGSTSNYLGLGVYGTYDIVKVYPTGEFDVANGTALATFTGEVDIGSSSYSPASPSYYHGTALTAGAWTYNMGGSNPAHWQVAYFGQPTFSASGTTTLAVGATLYINGAPANGSNVTITLPLAIDVAAGNIMFSGNNLELGSTSLRTQNMLNIDGSVTTVGGSGGTIRLSGASLTTSANSDLLYFILTGGTVNTGANTGLTWDGIVENGVTFSGSGTFTAAYGINVANTAAGSVTLTTSAGIAVQTQTGGTHNTDFLVGTLTIPTGANYGIYQGDTYVNYLNAALTVNGTVTTLGGATFHTTSTALSNGAGSSAGTLTNAPAVGNPTKWIGINDNGTTRYVPAW